MNVFNQRVRAVLRREYLQRVRNKWFLITTLLIPALMIGGIGLTVWLGERTPTESRTLRVGVVDRTELGLSGRLSGRFQGRGGRPEGGGGAGEAPSPSPGGPLLSVQARAAVEMAPAGVAPDLGPDELGALLSSSPYDVFLYLPPDLGLASATAAGAVPAAVPGAEPASVDAGGAGAGGGDPGGAAAGGAAPGMAGPGEVAAGQERDDGDEGRDGVRIVSNTSVSSGHQRVIRAAVQQAAIAALLERSGATAANPDEFLSASRLRTSVVRADRAGGGSQDALQVLGLILGGVLYFMLLVYGGMIVRGVIEEKSSDIVEVLISSLRPWEMMLGKILGVGAVGLTQVAIWGAVTAGVALYGLTAAAPALAEAGVDLGVLDVSLLPTLLTFLAFFLLGYLLYASLFAAAGALAGSEQDAQQVAMPVTIFIIGAFFLLFPVLESPDATWAMLVAQVPLFSPILMTALSAAGIASALETVSALLVLVLGVVGSVWLAGRIYRVGILMKGKRPNLPELIRWVRYG